MISDPIDGAPPEGLKPVPARALHRAAQDKYDYVQFSLRGNYDFFNRQSDSRNVESTLAKKNQVDPKKYLSELIKDLYLRM